MNKERQIIDNAYYLSTIYLKQHYREESYQILLSELGSFFKGENFKNCLFDEEKIITYHYLQNYLSTLNEKNNSRKKNGVYYTENDITEFILVNLFKLTVGKDPNNIFEEKFSDNDKERILSFSIFDPTCGTGAFLLKALEIKVKFALEKGIFEVKQIHEIVNTLFGNDVDDESILITKIRLFFCILENFGVQVAVGLSKILNKNFYSENLFNLRIHEKFDLVVGNPPYVEDSNSEISLNEKFGNIYANVLSVSLEFMKESGSFGFIIPLSYISTPRMKKIREKLNNFLKTQIILSFADRPGCLFTSVHQKLNIIMGSKKGEDRLYTGNYQYWYKEERPKLFASLSYINNEYSSDDYIPKLGNNIDVAIYKKIIEKEKILESCFTEKGESLYLNMRACFWIKSFLEAHTTGEYKKLCFENEDVRNYVYCILNSSLFWWFWICISDCWHITNKELKNFKIPSKFDKIIVKQLSLNLENKLENTKKYVGTKQTDYEYKHKKCLTEIHEIDEYINNLFGLSESESFYVKNFAISYRTSVGIGK